MRNELRTKQYITNIQYKSQLLITGSVHLEFKRNFLRISQMVLIGGPDDGLICPWQSRYGHPFVWFDFLHTFVLIS